MILCGGTKRHHDAGLHAGGESTQEARGTVALPGGVLPSKDALQEMVSLRQRLREQVLQAGRAEDPAERFRPRSAALVPRGVDRRLPVQVAPHAVGAVRAGEGRALRKNQQAGKVPVLPPPVPQKQEKPEDGGGAGSRTRVRGDPAPVRKKRQASAEEYQVDF